MKPLRIFFTSKKYFAIGFSFAAISFLFSTWIIYIPFTAEKLELDEKQIGLALFFISLGAFTIMPLSSRILEALGEGKAVVITILTLSTLLIFPFLAETKFLLYSSLYFVGISSGFLGIAVNALVTVVEKQEKVLIMNGSHGFYSLGGVTGAGLGGLLASVLNNPVWHAIIVLAFMAIVQLILASSYIHIKTETELKKENQPFNLKPVLGLALVGFSIMIGEGAIADWSSLYLQRVLDAPTELIGMGYAGFSFMMAIGRFYGDKVTAHWGSAKLIQIGCLIGASGLLLVISASLIPVLIGFMLIGLGFSGIIPEIYRLAGSIENVKPSEGIAAVSGTGHIGFLIGPVGLGYIAGLMGLQASFGVLLLITLFSFVMSRVALKV
ncbi:MFS transporter [Chondrinema litorale]|uniref:MFS transporter n=1 Tax=Chondrinema litorale TaxID=2994555 RepID=UPI0025436ACF|nr:MFS transporter [Chondrinema litorale]UZR99313.1 MFS transporter [Chondrinema litorale]